MSDVKITNSIGERFDLADHLRKAMKASNLSVYRIAKGAGVDQSTLNKFFKGHRNNLRLDVASRLFDYLGLSVVQSRDTQLLIYPDSYRQVEKGNEE